MFADRASLFENLKDVQIITPIEQGSGITAATCKKYDLPPLRTANVPVKCRQATSTSNGFACQPLPGRHTREAAFLLAEKMTEHVVNRRAMLVGLIFEQIQLAEQEGHQ